MTTQDTEPVSTATNPRQSGSADASGAAATGRAGSVAAATAIALAWL